MSIKNSFFFLNSSSVQYCNDNLLEKIKNLLMSYLFGVLLILIAVVILINPLDFLIIKYLHFESVSKLISQNHKRNIMFPAYIMVFIGPFAEEILFRLILIVNKFNISVFIGLILYKILGGQIVNFDINNQLFLYYILISFIFSLLCYYYFPIKLIAFIYQRIKYLIIISIVLFGLLHIFNVKLLYAELAIFYPFYVLPQMIMGYFITNLRLKYGFLWGFSLHALFNALNILLSHS